MVYVYPAYRLKVGALGCRGREQHQPDRFAVTGPYDKRTRMHSALLAMMQPYPAHQTHVIRVPGLQMRGGGFVVRGERATTA
jgi:hypothetical protein